MLPLVFFAKEVSMTSGKENWSQDVTGKSDALNLEDSVFTKEDPAEIAASLKRSAEKSGKRKSSPYASAMSMLTFHINRAGSNLSKKDRDRLEEAKDELRKQFGREPKSD
jgi:putative cell wall-binding protein|tara:strand:+ start:2196 stop:2525 length:330 start_codon:yes stop_codon:yes gene_type:complete